MKRREFCHTAGWVAGGVLIAPQLTRTILAHPHEDVGYRLQLATSSQFAAADLIYDIQGYVEAELKPSDLVNAQTYFWRVVDEYGVTVDLKIARDIGYFSEPEMLTYLVDMYNGLTLPWIISRETSVGTEPRDELPQKFALGQNYPNPFNPVTTIPFVLPKASFVRIKVYNLLGQEVATIAEQDLSAGEQSVSWNVSDLASGTYVYALQAGEYSSSRQMTLLK